MNLRIFTFWRAFAVFYSDVVTIMDFPLLKVLVMCPRPVRSVANKTSPGLNIRFSPPLASTSTSPSGKLCIDAEERCANQM